MDQERRSFLKTLSAAASAFVLAPIVTACGSESAHNTAQTSTATSSAGGESDPLALPLERPEGWDPIAWNRRRGNAGAIPESYWPQINAADGATNALGKHLPYVPEVDRSAVPPGYVALMWGDPSKGYARHPNAVRGPDNDNEGHWFDWIEIRKATEGAGQTARNTYPEWPGTTNDSHYLVFGGGAITDDAGKNTIYLAMLPPDVQPGDLVRVWAHCKTHGEYVDFLTIPA